MASWKKLVTSGSSPIFDNTSICGTLALGNFTDVSASLASLNSSTVSGGYLVYQTGSGTSSIKPKNGSNTASGTYSTVLGGCSNTVETYKGAILNGCNNSIIGNNIANNNYYNTILNGRCHQISGSIDVTILGGQCNSASYARDSIVSGCNQKIIDATGDNSNYKACAISILGGGSNTIYNWYTGTNLSVACRAYNIGLFNSINSTVSGSRAISMLGGSGHDVVTTASNGSHSSTVVRVDFIGGVSNLAGSATTSSVVSDISFIGGHHNKAYGGTVGSIIGGKGNCLLNGGGTYQHEYSTIISSCYSTITNTTSLGDRHMSVIVGGRYNSMDGTVCSNILGGSSNSLKLTRNSHILGNTLNSTITGSSNSSPNISTNNTIVGGCNVNLYNTSGVIAIGVHNKTISNCQITGTKVFMDTVEIKNLCTTTEIESPIGKFEKLRGASPITSEDTINVTASFDSGAFTHPALILSGSEAIQATGSVNISGSLSITGFSDVSASLAAAASDPFPFTGDAEITGSLTISGSLLVDYNDNDNIFISTPGSSSGDNNLTTGAYNLVIGMNAGENLTDSNNNIILGHEAASGSQFTSEKGNNIVVGYRSGLNANPTNYGENIFIGTEAGRDSKGNQSIFIGGGSGKNAEGLYNTAIGFGTMEGNNYATTPNYNTVIGYRAGYRLWDGNNNVAIGNSALYAGDSFKLLNNNIAIGQNSLDNAECIEYSIAIGTHALGSAHNNNYPASNPQGAGYNIAIGNYAGFSEDRGKQHIFIGEYAGYNVTNSTGSIIIGSGSRGETTLNHQLRIGNTDVHIISGSLTTGDIIFYNTASAPNFSGSFQGDGSQLTNLPPPSTPTLQQVTDAGASTTTAVTLANLTVTGTASFQHTTDLDVADRFIKLASGSNADGVGGIAVQQTSATDAQAFGWDNATGRWGITSSFNASQNTFTPSAYMGTVINGTDDDPNNLDSSLHKAGNIYIDTDKSTDGIWLYG